MIRGREQSTGRVIRTGWSEADGSSAARTDREARSPHEARAVYEARTQHHQLQQHSLPAVVVLLLAVVVALPWLVGRVERPEDVVRAYLQALVVADSAALSSYLADSGDVIDLALSPEIARATENRVRDFSFEEVEVHGLEAVVTAVLTLGDTERTVDFALHGVRTGTFGPVRWFLDPVHLPQLDLALPVGTTSVLVNGVEVGIPEVTWRSDLLTPLAVTVRVLPGTYRIALPAAGRPMVAEPVTVHVPLLGEVRWTGKVVVDADLDPAGVSAALAVLHDELAICASSTVPEPVGCPFGVDLPDDVRGHWTILASPHWRYFRAFYGAFDFSGRGLVATFTEESGGGAVPGRIHEVRRDTAASVVHSTDGYALIAWRYTTVLRH